MFDRIYKNHLFVLLEKNAHFLEQQKIEKVFKIIEFLITEQNDDISGFKSTIEIKEDLSRVLVAN